MVIYVIHIHVYAMESQHEGKNSSKREIDETNSARQTPGRANIARMPNVHFCLHYSFNVMAYAMSDVNSAQPGDPLALFMPSASRHWLSVLFALFPPLLERQSRPKPRTREQ